MLAQVGAEGGTTMSRKRRRGGQSAMRLPRQVRVSKGTDNQTGAKRFGKLEVRRIGEEPPDSAP